MFARVRAWTANHRRLVVLLGTLAAAATIDIVRPPAAQAYTCPPNAARTIALDDGSASAIIYVSRDCSDGRARVDTIIRDIDCDARRASLRLEFRHGDDPLPFRIEEPGTTHGCYTTAAFYFSSNDPNPKLFACMRAIDTRPANDPASGPPDGPPGAPPGAPTQSYGDCDWF